jgi:hypothetical protein
MARRWQWAAACMWILCLAEPARAGGLKVVTLIENAPVADGGYLPFIDVGKFSSVSLLGSLGSEGNVLSVVLDCRFTLQESGEFGSVQSVTGFEATVTSSGIDGTFPSPVAGPFLLCREKCGTTSGPPPCSGGPITLTAVLFKK